MSIYDFTVKNIKGEEESLSKYQGMLVLIVNTATGCGFTPQYEGLQKLYDQYKDQGFTILDFPCNQFGHQAPGSNEEIQSFCTMNYGVTFPQFAKIDVNGENEHPLYTFLKQKQGGLLGDKIKWNFTKFLIDQQGNVIERYAPTDTPEKIGKKIEELI